MIAHSLLAAAISAFCIWCGTEELFFHTPPTVLISPIPCPAVINIRQWMLTVPPCKYHPLLRLIIHELHPPYILGRRPLLHPVHDCKKHVIFGFLLPGKPALANEIRARPTAAMVCTRDAEIAIEFVEGGDVPRSGGVEHEVVVPVRVTHGGKGIRLFVPVQDLASAIAECGKVGIEGVQVAGVSLDDL